VLGGHEVGAPGRDETVPAATIAAVVGWCRAHDVWVDTIGAVARRVAKVTGAV
jgi:hypothetical protein